MLFVLQRPTKAERKEIKAYELQYNRSVQQYNDAIDRYNDVMIEIKSKSEFFASEKPWRHREFVDFLEL